jgi:hypothetical protein
LIELPGLACIWASYSYTFKTYIKLATPIVVAILMALPLPVVRFCAKRAAAKKRNLRAQDVDAQDAAREQETMWKERYERTIDVFWNNIMVSYVVVSPVMLLLCCCFSITLRSRRFSPLTVVPTATT